MATPTTFARTTPDLGDVSGALIALGLHGGAAPAPVSPNAVAETITVEAYAALGREVRDLVARAAEPNVFAEPAMVVAAARAHPPGALKVIVAYADHGRDGRRLIGAMPLLVTGRMAGARVASARPHAYAVLSTPLLDARRAEAALLAMFDRVAADRSLPTTLRFPMLGAGGPVEAAFHAAAARGGRALRVIARGARARLNPVEGGSRAFLAARFPGQKRKKYRNERRKLEALGDVTFTRHGGARAADALEEFLALEAASWKGRAGTAIVCDPVDAGYIRKGVAGLAADGNADIVALRVDGRAVAMGLVLRSGGAAWFHKVAYAEDVAKVSPGGHLMIDLTAMLLDETGFRFADSCVIEGAGALAGTWTGEQPIVDLAVDATPGASFAFPMMVAVERARLALRARAKALHRRWRG
jgi:CelD/BcsL family acetyltransferase involved in cellulose biosynthesis